MKFKNLTILTAIFSTSIVLASCNSNQNTAYLSVTTNGYGTVTSTNYKGFVGDTFEVTLTPTKGYKVDEIIYNNLSLSTASLTFSISYTKTGENELKVNFTKSNGGTVDPDDDNDPVDEGGFTQITTSKTTFNYQDLGEQSGSPYIPSTGNSKVIIVPIQFSDLSYTWTSTRLNALKVAATSDNNPYWESLKTYYQKSSYGKLNLDISIADTIIPSMKASKFTSLTDDYGTDSLTLIDEIYSKITVDGVNLSKNYSNYDTDDDDYIDGIWFIYNQFDGSKVDSDNFWAYTYWYYEDDSRSTSLSNCHVGTYANMAASFLYDENSDGYDAHTLIHETGHMLGFDDYYSYDSGVQYGYLGGLDMMDFNIGDHNPFSKFSLKWIEPYLLTGDKGIVKLRPFQSSGDALIIPSTYFNNSAFGEYLILQYYTPTDLNELDSTYNYGSYPKLFSQSGILVYHVDARIYKLTYSNNGYKTNGLLPSTATSFPSVDYYSYYGIASSNSKSYQYNGNALISLLGRDKKTYYNKTYATNNALFKQGDTINSLSFSSSVFKNNKFNDNSTMGYSLEIESLTSESVSIKFSK